MTSTTTTTDRTTAVEQRDAARARVRRLTLGVLTISVAAGAVGAVALGGPSNPVVTAPAGQTAGSVQSVKGSTVTVQSAGSFQPPVASSGGS